MSESPVYLTQSGLDALQEELDYLVGERRQQIAQQIAEAKAEGDLRENAGYDEAKNAQAFVEGRIRELKVKIHNAQIIDDSQTPNNEVALGRSVVVRENGYDDEEIYTIVGSTENRSEQRAHQQRKPYRQGAARPYGGRSRARQGAGRRN